MPLAALHNSWPQILDNEKNCIIIFRLNKYHVRRYKRDVKGGISFMRAIWQCGYNNLMEGDP